MLLAREIIIHTATCAKLLAKTAQCLSITFAASHKTEQNQLLQILRTKKGSHLIRYPALFNIYI